MRDLVILFVHVISTLARLVGPGGIRSVVAESVLVKQQLVILNRSRQRAGRVESWRSCAECLGSCLLGYQPQRLGSNKPQNKSLFLP